eukprot:Clim_evm37s235 gene=Clim_evmTU37s235
MIDSPGVLGAQTAGLRALFMPNRMDYFTHPEIGLNVTIDSISKEVSLVRHPEKEVIPVTLPNGSVAVMTVHDQEIYLFDRALTCLPSEVTQMAKAHLLDLTTNRIGSIPKSIVSMRSLTTVYLNDNGLRTLPGEFFTELNITVLDLHSNELVELPPEIGQCQSLEKIYLSNNPTLKHLPEEITQCGNLSVVYAYNCALEELPESIGDLRNLTILDVTSNLITTLPRSMGRLAKLSWLYVRNNRLTALIPELGNLTQLSVLYCKGNNLSSLPYEFCKLRSLVSFNCDLPIDDEVVPRIVDPGVQTLQSLASRVVIRTMPMGRLQKIIPKDVIDNVVGEPQTCHYCKGPYYTDPFVCISHNYMAPETCRALRSGPFSLMPLAHQVCSRHCAMETIHLGAHVP